MDKLNVKEYDILSDQIVEGFLNKEASLNDGILKAAQDNEFNPEQIKRLVEMSNTKAFIKLFKDKSGDDRDTNFDVADSQEVLKRYYSGSEDQPKSYKVTKITIVKNAEQDFELDIPDMMRSIREGKVETPEEKVAGERISGNEIPVISEKYRIKNIFQLRKVAEELMNRVYESEYDYKDCLDDVASKFCELYGPEYEDFEKEAIYRYGRDNIYVNHALNDIRACIRWDKPLYNPTDDTLLKKVASEETEELKKLRKMCDLKKIQIKYAEGVSLVNKKLEKLYDK